jgi:hypothetical protein
MPLYAYALEPSDPAGAQRAAHIARGLGWTASLVGDESTLDFRTPDAHAEMLDDMAAVADAARTGAGIDDAFVSLIEHVSGSARGGLAGRSDAAARVRALRDAVPRPGANPRADGG